VNKDRDLSAKKNFFKLLNKFKTGIGLILLVIVLSFLNYCSFKQWS